MSVFLYAGQGSQFVGMGADMMRIFPEFQEIAGEIRLDFDAVRLMKEGPAGVLSDTRYTQPCMALFAAGVTAVLRDHGIFAEAACGLSLGEYGALHAADVWDAKTYIELTAFRGKAMSEAAAGKVYAMSAVLNAEDRLVEEICREITGTQAIPDENSCSDAAESNRFVFPVNFNGPGQVVICGDPDSVEKAELRLDQEPRVQTKRLQTTAPFHTPVLEPAKQALREKFECIPFHTPKIPVAVNVTGKLLSQEEDLKCLLAEQVVKPVRFREDLTALLEAGADDFIEIGPGQVLSGLCKRTARALGKKVRIRTVQTAEDLCRCLE